MRSVPVIAVLALGLGACAAKGTTEGQATGGARGTGGATTSGGVQGSGAASTGGGPGMGGTTATGGAPDEGGTPGGGDTRAAGGAIGTGGTSGPGGVTSVGGMASTGGTTDSGGTPGRGGVTGSGGASCTGSTTGSGGATGSGGETTTGGTTGKPDAAEDVARDVTSPRTDVADAQPAQCPSSSTLKAGDNRATLQHDGRSRSYVVYVPSSIKANTPVPLVFDFHGSGGTGAQEESASGWKKKADQAGFVMVYPDGVGKAWNVGNCCGEALSGNVDDVGFTRAMIEAVSQAACIDAKRIYVTGMSNGAGLAHRLACEAADVIAAIAAASADLVTDPCTPARPISELSVRGLDDTMVNYAGGNTGSTGWYSPGAKGTLELWKDIDQCTGSVSTSRQYCETYSSCSASVEITLCSLPNTGHDTYNNAVGFSVPDVAWEMFQRQPMP
jgi:poly(3-hydroxybutyrate) depolymerase